MFKSLTNQPGCNATFTDDSIVKCAKGWTDAAAKFDPTAFMAVAGTFRERTCKFVDPKTLAESEINEEELEEFMLAETEAELDIESSEFSEIDTETNEALENEAETDQAANTTVPANATNVTATNMTTARSRAKRIASRRVKRVIGW